MSTVEESVEVSVPVQTAYNQWTQFESFPKFMRGVESIIQIDDTHNHWVTDLAGVRREFDTEITEQRPDERIAWHTVDGDTHHAGVVTFHRLDDQRSKVMIQLDWEPSGPAEKAASAVGVEDRQIRLDAERFKQFIESRKTETGAWRGEVT